LAACSVTPSKSPTPSANFAPQDWFIRYQLNAVPGVAEVASIGGHVQQYQVDVDPNRLRTYNLPLSAVVSAVRDSNLNVGGNVLESNGAWLIMGVGLIESVDA
jgi:Cu(I)/Ag(I) efflux system membrane protein CusA/SilA